MFASWPLEKPSVVACSAALLTLAITLCDGGPMHAQQTVGQQAGEEYVELNLTGSVSLPRLVEAVSRQLNVRFLYSADLANRQVTIYTPARLPKSALPILLGSLLKGENLVIVDSDVPGWKRIVDIADMTTYAATGEASEILSRDGPAAAVTQVIPIRNADITQMSQTFRKFLSSGANFIPLPDNRLIIITDYAQNVKTVVELLKMIDDSTGQSTIEFYETQNRTPASLIEQVDALIAKGTTTDEEVKLFNDASGKRVIVAGDQTKVTEAIQLLKQLDTGMDFQTRVYRLQNVSAERIDKLIRGLVSSEEAETAIETTIDEEGNLLVVRASADVQSQIKMLLRELDRPVDSTESPIQFYKLKNANAVEVLYSLLALQQAAGIGQGPVGGVGFGQFGMLGGLDVGGVAPGGVLPMGFGGSTGGQTIRVPFDSANADAGTVRVPANGALADDRVAASTMQNQNGVLSPLIGGGVGGIGATAMGGLGVGGGQVATLPGGARVSADVATNSLIVYAPSNVQPLYEKLIRSLDQRRPQVLIEAEIVAVDTSDNFALGVEVSIGDRTGANKLFKFTSFGLSEVDPTNGMLSLPTPPDLGFNGVLLDPDVADVVVQALSSHTRSRVLASPKILVNDNQTGTLESVASVPFRATSVVNSIENISLGGDQQAGTIITVTPHINEDDHLQLEFEVEFSTFGQGGTDELPPPRQIDRVGSVVTIPDGKTVVVGGLKRITQDESFAGVPWTENIPVLRELTSRTTEDGTTTSFFLFIRSKILRDSRFRDLRYLSDNDVQEAQISGDFPQSHPIVIPCPKPPTPTSNRPRRAMKR